STRERSPPAAAAKAGGRACIDLGTRHLAQLRLQELLDLRLAQASFVIVLETANRIELIALRLADGDEIGADIGRILEYAFDLCRIAVGEGERRTLGRPACDLKHASFFGRRQLGVEAGEQEAAEARYRKGGKKNYIARLDRELENRTI